MHLNKLPKIVEWFHVLLRSIKDNIELYINYVYYDYIYAEAPQGHYGSVPPNQTLAIIHWCPPPSPNFRENVIHDHYLKVANLIVDPYASCYCCFG